MTQLTQNIGSPQQLRPEAGYNISDTHEKEKRALYQAFELVRKAKRTGAEMRAWISATDIECKKLLINLRRKQRKSKEEKLWDLACLENRILADLRTYMNSIADIVSQLKPLNPPLKSEQLKPFAEAIITDRRTTVDAMTPLTQTVALVTAYKLDLQHTAPNAALTYMPPA